MVRHQAAPLEKDLSSHPVENDTLCEEDVFMFIRAHESTSKEQKRIRHRKRSGAKGSACVVRIRSGRNKKRMKRKGTWKCR